MHLIKEPEALGWITLHLLPHYQVDPASMICALFQSSCKHLLPRCVAEGWEVGGGKRRKCSGSVGLIEPDLAQFK